jgi:hypothetical protein
MVVSAWLALVRLSEAELVCPKDSAFVAYVNGVRIPLDSEHGTLPYGRQITLVVNPGIEVKSLDVTYALDGGKDGPRTGVTHATPLAGTGCWNAIMPAVHVNERGRFISRAFQPVTYRTGKSDRTLVTDYLRLVLHLPGGLDPKGFADQVKAAARKAAAENLADQSIKAVVIGDDGRETTLEEALAQLVVDDLTRANLIDRIQESARATIELMQGLQADPKWAERENLTCSGAATWSRLLASARTLAGSEEAVLQALVQRQLPWPACTVALFEETPQFKVATNQRGLVDLKRPYVFALSGLVVSDDLKDVAEGLKIFDVVLQKAVTVTEMALAVSSLQVPVGAEALERYLQADVLMAYLLHSDIRMAQAFATTTFYFFSPGRNFDFTAAAEDMHGSDRFGVQIGYPVGGPAHEPHQHFEPQVLVGLQLRVNAYLSVSAADVFGKLEGRDYQTFAFTTNIDISNLGPLQQLLARRDH